ncbi:MAG: DUF4124 domain-containing protein [Steroidobacteraceae bacterium]
MNTRKAMWSLLAVVIASVAIGSTITYRWTDADGVHYSDQPHAGAEKIVLGTPQTYSGSDSAPTVSSGNSVRRARNDDGFHYDSCAVVQPAQDQVLIDVESVTIAVQPRPAKRSTDRIELSMDGQAMAAGTTDQQEFKISPIDRGTHIVAATIRDGDGKNLCQSSAISFHVRQPSVLAPLNPNNPNRKH